METIGIIAEYNPLHNGHIYHINMIKDKYPNSIIILVLNGYFTERGEISVLNKKHKTELALKYGVDIVIELPGVFGTQAADIFANKSIHYLNKFGINRLIFGSESNDIKLLQELAIKQTDSKYQEEVKTYLDEGLNYPTALAKALHIDNDFFKPNDLLGISYIKAINEINKTIIPETIKRTNDYHDIKSNDIIISASNIRERITNNEDITSYIPKYPLSYIETINYEELFKLLKYKILTDPDLSRYLDVNEGIEYRLIDKIREATNLNKFIELIKTKRYTYNKIMRMLIHILVGFTKEDNNNLQDDYLKILGFSKKGQLYLHDNHFNISTNKQSLIYKYELRFSYLYQLLSSENDSFDSINEPVITN